VAGVIRLVVVEDHPLVALGTVEMARAAGDVRIVGTAAGIAEAVETVERERPDLVLCDVMLGERPVGLELPLRLEEGTAADIPVLFFSSFALPWFYATALANGGAGYVVKSATPEELESAIRLVASGGLAFPADVVRRVRKMPPAPSPREREIIGCVATGAANAETATTLGIGEKTVESRLARMYARYSVASRTELAMLALREGWIQPNLGGSLRR
jgi:DNA-binding NarL/FixJ family response regulator